ncbi:hypothetical protein Tter_2732 [Thermobaculum terrenum ATCC BAA-798]|uniref:Uncharacterized protein n=1 Tax=Thermobaculum terrenum (strain ATCC BAA-798 / CCMEE 7001 / YNP1) TaxID=525904 RepID=D1CIP9_THET1|nr:hypothetical protein [Thermobaculum terrenum]ACZ43619.1 hypothetical protein Tter_2732 [Thermobaculum terrenum ATCC BAA-798]
MRSISSFKMRSLIALVLGVLAAASWGLAVHRISQGASPTSVDSLLLSSNRSGLAICVDSKTAAISDDDLRRDIQDAMMQLKAHPHFVSAGLAVAEPRIDISCPGPARMLDPNFDLETGMIPGQSDVVTDPSQYRVFVFLVEKEVVAKANGYREYPQETWCPQGGDACGEVTTALYLTPEDLTLPARLERLLTLAVGLDPDPSTPNPFK